LPDDYLTKELFAFCEVERQPAIPPISSTIPTDSFTANLAIENGFVNESANTIKKENLGQFGAVQKLN
jgi:hypothetical protein